MNSYLVTLLFIVYSVGYKKNPLAAGLGLFGVCCLGDVTRLWN